MTILFLVPSVVFYLRFYGSCFGRSLLRFIAEWFGPSWIILHEQTQLQLYESWLHSETLSPGSRQRLLSAIIALQQVINTTVYQEIICLWFDCNCGYKSTDNLWKENCRCLSYPRFSWTIFLYTAWNRNPDMALCDYQIMKTVKLIK